MTIDDKPGLGAAFPQHSFWSEDYGPYTPTPQLAGNLKVDVAIIGAGFTGLSTAINLKKSDRAARIVILEQESVGYGASGRNSGWVWPNVTTYEEIYKEHGQQTLRETYQYAKQACAYLEELVTTHKLDSEYRKTGLLRPSVSEAYEPDRHAYLEFCEKLGRASELREMSEAEVQAEVKSPLFHKGSWDNELALIHPVKHARALSRLACELGAELYEQTPVISLSSQANAVSVYTPRGIVTADRVVIATNAYSHLLQGKIGHSMRRNQRPIFVYNTISRELTAEEWESVGWNKRCAVYSFGPASHFGNPTWDGRIHWCSDRFLTVPSGNDMSCEYLPNYNDTLAAQTPLFFPGLKNVELTHHWGGPVATTIDRIFHLGALDQNQRVFISVGCNGNAVSLTHLNGKILAELLTGNKSELSSLWFVNKTFKKWPPAWISVPAIRTVLSRENKNAARRAEKAGLKALVTESKVGID